MTQKIGNIILAVLVLCTTTGFVVNKHFSDGELYSVSVYDEAESCCQNEQDHMDTCHNESSLYKVKDYFRASSSISIQAEFKTINHPTYITEFFRISYNKDLNLFSELKLLKPKIPKPEFIQVFII